jgi:signal transduction histidine kinase
MRLQSKITLFFLGLFVLLLMQGIFFIRHERRVFTSEMREKGVLLAENLAEISRESIASFQLSRLSRQIDSMAGRGGIDYISIVDDNYLVLADTRKPREGWIFSGSVAQRTNVNLNDDSMVVTAPVYIMDELRGHVEISYSLNEVNEKIRENAFVFLLFFVLEVAGAILFLVSMELQVVKPLKYLTRKVSEVTPESLFEPMHLPGRRSSQEIEKVAAAIEEMKSNLKQAQDELVSKAKLATMGKISANFAHEIRNPLEAISGSAEILSYSIPPGSQESEYIEIIREEIAHLNDYLESFLEFSKKKQASPSLVSVKTLIHDTILLLRPLLQKRDIHVSESGIDTAAPVFVDPAQMKRVFVNLVLNSIEAMEYSTERSLEISAQEQDEYVILRIRDSGTGIPEELKQAVFDPYVTTKQNGTGIGLSVSRSIVGQNGGFVDILETSSEQPTGTIMSVHLPKQR